MCRLKHQVAQSERCSFQLEHRLLTLLTVFLGWTVDSRHTRRMSSLHRADAPGKWVAYTEQTMHCSFLAAKLGKGVWKAKKAISGNSSEKSIYKHLPLRILRKEKKTVRGRREQLIDRRWDQGKLICKAGAQKVGKQHSHCSEDKQVSSLHRLKQAHCLKEQNYLIATEKEVLLGADHWLWQALGAQESLSLAVSWDQAGGRLKTHTELWLVGFNCHRIDLKHHRVHWACWQSSLALSW